MNKCILIIIGLLAISLCGGGAIAQSYSFKPKSGFIPDERTAVSVALAVLEPIYGREKISAEQPFSAKLKDGIWTVTGSFPKGSRFGGVAEIRISRKSGCILSVAHGQ